MKVCYFDVETTGVLAFKHDMIEIACIIEVDGIIRDEFSEEFQPFDFTTIDEAALKVCDTNVEELKGRHLPGKAYNSIIKHFSVFIDKYNKHDKFYPAGFNVRFDVDFLWNFFKKNNDQYYGSWFNWKMLDPLPLLHWLDYTGKIKLDSYTLGSACEHFGIEMGQAHIALNDIRATRELLILLKERYFSKE